MISERDSVIYPFVVLFSIPVALVGALLALTMESLTVFSIVGMIMLLGLVAKNAILIVDFANQSQRIRRSGFLLTIKTHALRVQRKPNDFLILVAVKFQGSPAGRIKLIGSIPDRRQFTYLTTRIDS